MLRGLSEDWPAEVLYGNDRLSRALVHFFLTYLVIDSLLIYVDYPTIGGYVHHLPYFLFMAASLYFNCPAVFVVFMPMELSTIFLGAGFTWPSCRSDLLFGSTFFLGRLVYHVWLWVKLFTTRKDSPFLVWPFAALPYFIHAFWFYKWCRSMLRRRRKVVTMSSMVGNKNS